MDFVIVCPARSGSTMVREFLNKHPQLCCHGEVFGANKVLGYSKRTGLTITPQEALATRTKDPVDFLWNCVFHGPMSGRGFKLLYMQLFSLQFTPVLHELLSSHDLHVVHLWRRNLLARYQSEILFRIQSARQNGKDVGSAFLSNALAPSAVEWDSKQNIAARQCGRSLFSSHPSIEVAYEDFINPDGEERKRLCEFLGADPSLMPNLPEKPKNSVKPQDKVTIESYFAENDLGSLFRELADFH